MQRTNFTSSIIVGAGKGERFSKKSNKLFITLNGIPVIEHSLKKFNESNLINEIILVTDTEEYSKTYNFSKKYEKIRKVVNGGKVREGSVLEGLKNISEKANFVLIHDAGRPLFPKSLIEDEIRELLRGNIDGVIPVLPIYDAIKTMNGEFVIPNGEKCSSFRKELKLTQTPQGFNVKILKEAIEKNIDKLDNFRDEAELILSYLPSAKIKTIKGSFDAHKLTCRDDLEILGKIEFHQIRSGIGYDFHPFINGRPLIIGGIEIPYCKGLSGDSDADVLTHSIIDAILGALGKGDIGSFFGIGSKEVIGVKSMNLLLKLKEDENIPRFEIINIDSTIICKKPKILDYSRKIVENISKMLKIDENKINIKATTDKGFDSAGKGFGIRAITIATLKIIF